MKRIAHIIVTISEALPWIVLPLAATLAILTTHTPAHVAFAPNTPHTATHRVIPCHDYLSRAAMQSAETVHIPNPIGFCIVDN